MEEGVMLHAIWTFLGLFIKVDPVFGAHGRCAI